MATFQGVTPTICSNSENVVVMFNLVTSLYTYSEAMNDNFSKSWLFLGRRMLPKRNTSI